MSRFASATARAALLVTVLLLAPDLARAACADVDPSHSRWTELLGRFVARGQVDYAGLARDGRPALEAYLAGLSGACAADHERWTPAERIAFWINAYNAFTVKLILDHYPVASIRKIGWLPGAAFRRKFIPMQWLKGATLSLDGIEHDTLRSEFREPRIHFALVCAARSCPPLRGEAYRGADLERQLEEQGRAFLRDPARNRVDVQRRTLYLSSIFSWFRGDFESAAGSLQAFVAAYLEQADRGVSGYAVEFLDYDWALNDRATGAP